MSLDVALFDLVWSGSESGSIQEEFAQSFYVLAVHHLEEVSLYVIADIVHGAEEGRCNEGLFLPSDSNVFDISA